jgi:hypothetical protein
MRTRIVLCAGIVFCLAGILEAQDNDWIPLPGKKLWSDTGNWGLAELPTNAHKAKFQGPSECLVDFDGAECQNLDLGGGPLRIFGDGVLTVYDWSILGYGDNDVGDDAGRLEVYSGGVLNCMQRLYIGRQGEGYLTVYEDGTVNILGQHLHVAQTALDTSLGVVTLEGGTINILEGSDSSGLRNTGSNATVNFKGGLMRLRNTAANQTYLDTAINDGIVQAYDGVGEVVITTDEETGIISVRGVHPLKPSPSDDGLASPGNIELSWTLPDSLVAGQPVTVDVYFTDDLTALSQFTDPAAIQVVNNQSVTSVVVQTQAKTRYYWSIDAYVGGADDPVIGPIFSFSADNPPPIVDAGADLVTWLGEDGTRIKNVDATVTDNDAYTVQWTVVSEPIAVIDIQIADGSNDAEQHVDGGGMDIGSSDLELAYDDGGDPATDEQVIGLRFVDVPMENGAPVANAYVEVEVDKVDKQGSEAPVNLIIEGELAPDAAPFEDVANNITDRAVTTAQVKWSIPAWTEQDAKFQTPDISSIIMEINSQRNWAPGNAIVLIFRDDKDDPSTGLREAESYEGEEAAAPLLHIDLAGGPVVIEAPTAEDTNVTLSRLGEHVLQLEAFDGEYTGSDTVSINVYRDGCEAAKSLPDYVPLVGDLNGDCKVDEADLALLEENWLKDNSLTEP